MPDVLIAPDKLRGTYTAAEAADALGRGWQEVRSDDVLRLLPLADGGEGTAAALLAARGGRWGTAQVHDALGRPCEARFALLEGEEAALDVAEACGLWRVADVPRDPVGASSFGAGELIAAAFASGAHRVVVGVGGTASSDGGAGLREALGGSLPGELVAALDVDNPATGPYGAAAVYGPQKGATPEHVAELDSRIAALGLPDRPGAGAGGGIGGMLMLMGATAVPGGELVIAEAGLDDRLAGSHVCITAEGRIDAQTLNGKVVAVVAAHCRTAGVPCIAVGGQVEVSAGRELQALGVAVLEEGDLVAAGRQAALVYASTNRW
jgi:glycerate kinase